MLNALVVNDDMVGGTGTVHRACHPIGCRRSWAAGHNRENRRWANDRSVAVVEADATRSRPTAASRFAAPAVLIVGLSVVVLTVAVLQTAVVPVLGIIADQLDVSTGRGQLGGHRESARRRRHHPADRPPRRPAQQETRAAERCSRSCWSARCSRPPRRRWPCSSSAVCCRPRRSGSTPIGIAILREELPRTGWARRCRCCRERWASAAEPAWSSSAC